MPDTQVTQCFNSNLVILSSWRQKDDVHGQEEINQIKINNGEPQETIDSSAPGKERLRTRKRVAMSLTHIFCYCWSNSSLTQRSVSKEPVVCNTTENWGKAAGSDAKGSGLCVGQMWVCVLALRLPSNVALSWLLHFLNVRFLPYKTGIPVLIRGVKGTQWADLCKGPTTS